MFLFGGGYLFSVKAYTCQLQYNGGMFRCRGFGIGRSALFYVCNYCFSDDEAGHIEKTVVENKYYKVRHRTRRVSRGRYTQGEAYNVYYLKVRFGDGSFRDFF